MDKLQQLEEILNSNTLAEVHDFNLVYELSPIIQSYIDQAFEKIEELETEISDLEYYEGAYNKEQERADTLADELDIANETIKSLQDQIDHLDMLYNDLVLELNSKV